MLTYSLDKNKGHLSKELYKALKKDIEEGNLKRGEKLPSKRAFARNCSVSTITVQNAYDQLVSEGYITAYEKKGYFVSDGVGKKRAAVSFVVKEEEEKAKMDLPDLSNNRVREDNFPFSIWSRLMRKTMAEKQKQLLSPMATEGVYELRKAISQHLSSFRGMAVSPSQVLVGAGTEYLYSLIIQLLGRDKTYAIEDPGYMKLERIYESNGVKSTRVQLDEKGLSLEMLENSGADIAHISPNHHYPTGITMPLDRRYEILSWAAGKEDRYILEDDYDSEFRVSRNPFPTLYTLDGSGSVIYMNTFSKSLASTVRISYMVLPFDLAERFKEKLSFYSSTVSSFEQYTLASFILDGYFEKHINRMRLFYIRQRKAILSLIYSSPMKDRCSVIENDSGLHFILRLHTTLSDEKVKEILKEEGIKISALSDFSHFSSISHDFIISYSNLDLEIFKKALSILSDNV
ncbi:MAG: PLP-dependent aminotransferase family protein [Spirochaetales bacterium]|nr:PLP-dependent aminotransferase family protein [Spirochaetales bacterium]